jgi:hypothetical protein
MGCGGQIVLLQVCAYDIIRSPAAMKLRRQLRIEKRYLKGGINEGQRGNDR